MLWQARETFKVDPRAERDHQLVIGEVDRHAPRTLHHGHGLLGEVDAHDFRLPHLEAAQELADWHDRIRRMNAGRRNLRQKRLEHEVIIGVDELDLELAEALAFERLGGKYAAEAAADHEHLLLVRKPRHGSLSRFA